jgi:hypothetical protein
MLGVGRVSDASSLSISCLKDSKTSVSLGPNAGGQVEVHVEAEHPVWLEIEEHGVAVDALFEGSEDAREMPIPPRYAWKFYSINSTGTLRLLRKERGDPSASVSIVLHCKEELLLHRRIEWLSRAGSSASRVKQQQPLVSLEPDLRELENLVATAPDATTQAFAKHLRAQTFLLVATRLTQPALSQMPRQLGSNSAISNEDASRGSQGSKIWSAPAATRQR